MNRFLRKSGIGLPHSTTLARITARHGFREVVECGSPMPLSQYCGIGKPDPRFMERPTFLTRIGTSTDRIFSLSSTGGEGRGEEAVVVLWPEGSWKTF
jgi:hypothetical protein